MFSLIKFDIHIRILMSDRKQHSFINTRYQISTPPQQYIADSSCQTNMDKNAFFESLSFLRKVETNVWPPKIKTFSSNMILAAVSVSIEIEGKGPILVINKDKDPAMFDCDLAVLEVLQGSPSSASTSMSQNTPKQASSSSSGTTPRRSQEDEQHQSKTQLFIQIDQGKVYRIDSSRIAEVTMEKGNRPFPASILLHFHDCVFRIFSTTATDQLQAAYNTLFKLPRVPPEESSVTMSKEDAVESTKRKLDSLERGWNETVQCFLYDDKLPSSKDQVCKKLNQAAASTLYASTTELEQASAAQHDGLAQSQQELEDLLTAYFPRRTENDEAQLMEDCIEKAQAVMERKVELLQEQHRLTFLTTRG